MLTDREFANLAHLARLSPDDPALQGLQKDLVNILDFVARIQKAPVLKTPALTGLPETFREDKPEASLPADVLSAMAPAWESGHFVVPQVIDAE